MKTPDFFSFYYWQKTYFVIEFQCCGFATKNADVAELADALVSGSSEAIHVGSSPVVRTKQEQLGFISGCSCFFLGGAWRGNGTERTSGGRPRPWKTERAVRARIKSRRPHQKILQKRIHFLQYFFIQVADLVYHWMYISPVARYTFVYHHALVCISSPKVYSSATWWYSQRSRDLYWMAGFKIRRTGRFEHVYTEAYRHMRKERSLSTPRFLVRYLRYGGYIITH